MLKEKELTKLKQVKFRDGDSVSFLTIESSVGKGAEAYDIPVAFERDYIKSGGIIGSSSVECLVLYHPEYRGEYNFYAFTITRQGKYAFVDILRGGSSLQGSLMDAKKHIKEGSFSNLTDYGKGAVVGTIIGSVVSGKLFKSNTSKFNEEQNWYEMINDVIEDAFRG